MNSDNLQMQTTTSPSTSSLLDRPQTALRFRFVGGQRHGQVVRIASNKCTIGSSAESTFRLVCPGVQPVHCLILRGEGGVAVRRLSNDTLLNGRAFEDAPLNTGDRLTIGPIEFEVLAEAESRPARSPANDAVVQQLRAELEAERSAWEQRRDEEQQRLDNYAREIEAQALATETEQSQPSENEQSLVAEVESLRLQLEQFESQKSQTEQELMRTREALTAELSSAQEALNARNDELNSTHSQLVTLQSQLEASSDSSNELQELRAQCEELTRQLEAAAQNQQTEVQIAALQSQWEAERLQFRKQLEESQIQIQELNARSAQVEATPLVDDSMNESMAALEAKLTEIEAARQQERESFEAIRQQERADFEACQDVLNTTQEQLQSMQTELQRCQSELAAAGASQLTEEQATAGQNAYVEFNSDADQEPHLAGQDAYAEPPTPSSDNFAQDSVCAQLPNEPSYEQNPIGSPVADPSESFHEETPRQDRTMAMDMLDRLRQEVSRAEEGSSRPSLMDELQSIEDMAPQNIEQTVPAPPIQEVPLSAADHTMAMSSEDLIFSEPKDESPVDTAAILAKFGHTMEDLPPASEPTQTMPISPATGDVSAVIDATNGGEDESIDDYMQLLMARVGGGKYENQTPQRVANNTQTIAAPTQQVESAGNRPKVTSTIPLDPSEFVPRAVAPEASSNLRALRAVANSSSRSAIDKHQRRSLDRSAMTCWIVAIMAAFVCIAMGFFSKELMSLPSLVSLIAFAIAFLFAVKALAFSAKAKLGKRSTQKRLAANIE